MIVETTLNQTTIIYVNAIMGTISKETTAVVRIPVDKTKFQVGMEYANVMIPMDIIKNLTTQDVHSVVMPQRVWFFLTTFAAAILLLISQ